MKKLARDDRQLSLFESNESPPTEKPATPTTVLDFVRARFEHGPEMTPEEYRRWIKILIHNSLKSME
ncbi:MAG: hypothetical protein JST80_06685 [Bdellovibrionales bacterium]|nr:hypothetical protein [Bdellovibrionales bacterium]